MSRAGRPSTSITVHSDKIREINQSISPFKRSEIAKGLGISTVMLSKYFSYKPEFDGWRIPADFEQRINQFINNLK